MITGSSASHDPGNSSSCDGADQHRQVLLIVSLGRKHRPCLRASPSPCGCWSFGALASVFTSRSLHHIVAGNDGPFCLPIIPSQRLRYRAPYTAILRSARHSADMRCGERDGRAFRICEVALMVLLMVIAKSSLSPEWSGFVEDRRSQTPRRRLWPPLAPPLRPERCNRAASRHQGRARPVAAGLLQLLGQAQAVAIGVVEEGDLAAAVRSGPDSVFVLPEPFVDGHRHAFGAQRRHRASMSGTSQTSTGVCGAGSPEPGQAGCSGEVEQGREGRVAPGWRRASGRRTRRSCGPRRDQRAGRASASGRRVSGGLRAICADGGAKDIPDGFGPKGPGA